MDESVLAFSECETYANLISRAFCEGGVVMYFIAVIGILTTFLIIERFLTLSKLVINKKNLQENLFALLVRGDLKQAIAYCDSRSTPLTNTVKSGLIQVLNQRPDVEVQVAMDAEVLQETPRLEGWTSFLAVFGNVAVLIGLFGTIMGMIISFKAVAKADAATKSLELTRGISEALNCTAFGLGVAITAIIFYGFFQLKIGRAINDMLETSMKLMNIVTSNRDKLNY